MKARTTVSLYWKCQLLGWSIAALYWGYLAYTGRGFSLPVALLHFFTDVMICISVTHVFRFVSKKLRWEKLNFQQLLVRIIPSVVLLALIYMLISIGKLYLVHINFRKDFFQSFPAFYMENSVSIFMGGLRLMSIWLLAYYLFQYAQRELRTMQENARLSVVAKEAQLSNLSSQLNPHFLFNSLNSIKSLVIEDPDKSRRSIDLLADLLRKSLYDRDSMLVTIKEELSAVNDYLELEKIRFEERLQFLIDVPESISSLLIIPFSIQTLVENAVKHGINKHDGGGSIKIKIGKSELYIQMSVESPGFLDEAAVNKGLGLKNLQERLKIQFHNKASFHISQGQNETVLATIIIPAA
jgi:sensor histidine kinase YesM